MLEIKYNNDTLLILDKCNLFETLNRAVLEQLLHPDFYLLHNGKRVSQECLPCIGVVNVVPKLVGGKGGFGSMLRAIGAQIEKTTNREACRDLSGRRLRDINEEKRLKTWIDKQATREQEAEDKRQKKLERLVQTPKYEFKDAAYDKERSELPERLEDAVTQGMQAVASVSSTAASTSQKRKNVDNNEIKKKKMKGASWLEDDIDISSGDDSTDSDEDDSSKSSNTETANADEKVVATN